MPSPDYAVELLALEQSIASGTTRVSYEGKTVDFDSFEGLLKRWGFLRRLAGISTASASAVSSFDRGDDEPSEGFE